MKQKQNIVLQIYNELFMTSTLREKHAKKGSKKEEEKSKKTKQEANIIGLTKLTNQYSIPLKQINT